jgi:hypothetical protein
LATFSDKIRLLFEVDDKGSFGKIKRDIADAEGATGKLKAGTKGLGDMLKQNAAPAAIAAGAALVAFGVKAVNAFQDAALGAGKFADATGLAVEDASRWIEVAGDLGIEAGTIQGAFQKLNKSIADGKPALSEYGVEIVKTKDGIVDANATFINAATTIGKIEDPTKRAKAAQELFGKSYGEVAELLEMSAGDVQTALAGVSDAKVIDEDELRKARNFRESMDNLRDKLEDLALTVGESLVPQLADLAEQAVEVAEVGVKVGGKFADVSQKLYGVEKSAQDTEQALFDLAPAIERAGLDFDKTFMAVMNGETTLASLTAALELNDAKLNAVTDSVSTFERRMQSSYIDTINDAEQATKDLEQATKDLEGAYSDLRGEISDEQAWLSLEDSMRQYRWDLAEGKLSNDEMRVAANDLKLELIDVLESIEDVPAQKQTEILALIDQGKFDEAELALSHLTRQRAVAINPTTGFALPNVSTGRDGRRAMGGPVSAGGSYLVGENGPEVLQMGSAGGNIVPNHALGGSMNVVINTAADPNSVIAAIKQYERLNGKGWRS